MDSLPYIYFLRVTTQRTALVLAGAALIQAGSARALMWEWSFDAPDSPPYGAVAATGRLRTGDTPDGNGFFTILDASGQRNGVAITGLQGAGSSIPGNAGYFSDNLVRLGTEPLTKNGFNVSYADGSFSNFFTATFLSPVVDMDFHSVPPNFSFGPETERKGVFVVRQVPVPGPLPAVGVGLALAWSRRLRSRRDRVGEPHHRGRGLRIANPSGRCAPRR
jgi:hypothetical protein